MRVHSLDACGTTRGHQRIQACAESHRLERSNDYEGSVAILPSHPITLRTERSKTLK